MNPDFFSRYEFKTTLPGPSLLTLQVYDHNRFLPSRLMGETVIDLEDRWFHPKWTSCGDFKPLEVSHFVPFMTCWFVSYFLYSRPEISTRNIQKLLRYISRICLPLILTLDVQGILLMWVDIFTVPEAGKFHPVPIARPAPQKFEVGNALHESFGEYFSPFPSDSFGLLEKFGCSVAGRWSLRSFRQGFTLSIRNEEFVNHVFGYRSFSWKDPLKPTQLTFTGDVRTVELRGIGG